MKNFLCLLLALTALSGTAQAATYAEVLGAQFDLNHANAGAMAKWQLGDKVQKGRVIVAKCKYDFSVSGGSSGSAIKLLDEYNHACVLPKNAIVRNVIIDTVTTLVGTASPTIALGTGKATNDIKTAALYTGYSAIIAGIPVGTAATAIKMTADVTPTATLATGFLTAGKFNVLIEYQISD